MLGLFITDGRNKSTSARNHLEDSGHNTPMRISNLVETTLLQIDIKESDCRQGTFFYITIQHYGNAYHFIHINNKQNRLLLFLGNLYIIFKHRKNMFPIKMKIIHPTDTI